MDIPFLDRIRQYLDYDTNKTPLENLKTFFEGVSPQRYEWAEIKNKDTVIWYLDSAWKGEVGLKSVTMDFQEAFTAHIVNLSMSESLTQDYMQLLKECKEFIRKVLHHFSIPFTERLIILRPLDMNEEQFPVTFDPLSENAKLTIDRCHQLLVTLFMQLEEYVNDEIKEYERKEYVREKSTYAWKGDKNKVSELALALFLSGGLERRDGNDVVRNVFARELAAFLGIDKINIDQDIASLKFRTVSSTTPFLDFLKEKVKEYHTQSLKNQD